jgi:hypothetical protein
MSSDESYDSYDMNDDNYDRDGKDIADAAPVDKKPGVGSQDTPDTKKTMPRPARFEMKYHRDVPLSQLDVEDREQAALIVSRDERSSTIIQFKQELIDIKNKSKDPTSGMALCKRKRKIRKKLVLTILRCSRMKYASEEHEYKAIGKFYRGMFRKVAYNDHRPRKHRLFDDAEQAILVEIAKAYGAFGY